MGRGQIRFWGQGRGGKDFSFLLLGSPTQQPAVHGEGGMPSAGLKCILFDFI